MNHPNTSEHWNTSGIILPAREAAACRCRLVCLSAGAIASPSHRTAIPKESPVPSNPVAATCDLQSRRLMPANLPIRRQGA